MPVRSMTPSGKDKAHTITYPPNCKELHEDLGKDELIRRLKGLARALQDMGQDEDQGKKYGELALFLATEFFMENSSKDIQLLTACCVADVFRIFAPDAPYTEAENLRDIFLFIITQLKGLDDTEAPNFKRHFYLLENLAWVKSFNICIELECNQEIFCKLFKLMFSIVSEKHSAKVVNFMLDMMSPLLAEADTVSGELLDIILINIIEPHRTQNRHAYNLAHELIKRSSGSLEPHITQFFHTNLMIGKTPDSQLGPHMYNLIYQLYVISPSILLAVLPQLEFKLKSSDESERRQVVQLLAKMFSDPGSELSQQNKPLWMCFLGRFNDVDVNIRRICVQTSHDFIVNHPQTLKEIAEILKQRMHDLDENVRLDAVQAIVTAARKEVTNITPELLEIVRERTLDKKLKIRKEALTGLGQIYKRVVAMDSKTEFEKVTWIPNKVLYAYYRQNADDRVLVERVINTCLVPYSCNAKDRMLRLFKLYAGTDDHSLKSFNEIFATQNRLRLAMRGLLDLQQRQEDEQRDQLILQRLNVLSRALPDNLKALEYLKKFNRLLMDDTRTRAVMCRLVAVDITCKKAEECVKEVLKKLGNPIPQNYLYSHIKTLLERIAPVMIDSEAIEELMTMVEEAVSGIGEICDEIPRCSECGPSLLLKLAPVYPGAFQSEKACSFLMSWIRNDDEKVVDVTLQILAFAGRDLERLHPAMYSSLLPILQNLIRYGTPKQAKHAVVCIKDLYPKNHVTIFNQIFKHLNGQLDPESPNFLTALVAIGHMAHKCPAEFATPVKVIVSKFLVKELLMKDKGKARKSAESWYADHLVSDETQAKIQALKLMVRWLLGLAPSNGAETSRAGQSALSTLRLLHTLILHEGDLMEHGMINKAEMARLRLQAGCCMLRLAQESCYADSITLEQFHTLAFLLNDQVYQVRLQFCNKLHKALMSLRLPLMFMSIFCLGASEVVKDRKLAIKQCLQTNIQKRRDYLRQNPAVNTKQFSILPDYVLPYAIHMLAHDPDLGGIDDVETLKHIKECLWFLMEPLITKNETYSYNFYKTLIENIKQTKDIMAPENEESNHKMYAVCDLALGLVMTKTANFVLKDFPADPVLPAKLFTSPDMNTINTHIYLPTELQFHQSTQPRGVRRHAHEAKVKVKEKASSPRSGSESPGSPSESRTVARGRGRQGKITDFVKGKSLQDPGKRDAANTRRAKTTKRSSTESPRGRGRPKKQKVVESENDDEEEEEEEEEEDQVEDDEDGENEEDEEEEEEMESEGGRPEHKTSSRGRRMTPSRKAAYDVSEDESDVTPAKKGRGRPRAKHKDSSSPSRSGRHKARGDASPEAEEDEEESPRKNSRSGRGATAAQVETESSQHQRELRGKRKAASKPSSPSIESSSRSASRSLSPRGRGAKVTSREVKASSKAGSTRATTGKAALQNGMTSDGDDSSESPTKTRRGRSSQSSSSQTSSSPKRGRGRRR